jgi:hypothetical protein
MVTKPRALPYLLAMLTILLVVPARLAEATLVVQAVSATTNMTENGPLVNAIDQSGLSVGYVSGVTDFDTYTATHDTSTSPVTVFSATDLSSAGIVDFNLGSSFLIDRIAIWGTDFPGLDMSSFDLSADDNASFTSPTALGTFSPAAQSADPQLKQTFSFTPVSEQYFRLSSIVTSHGTQLAIGEVAFSAVPEARAWLGLGLVCGVFGLGYARRTLINRRMAKAAV